MHDRIHLTLFENGGEYPSEIHTPTLRQIIGTFAEPFNRVLDVSFRCR